MTFREHPFVLVDELIDVAEQEHPSAPAVRDPELALTYRELAVASRRLTQWLAEQGVRRGDRVLVRHPNSARLVALVYAVSRAGAVLVPISTAMSRYQLMSVIADADPTLILCTDDEMPALHAATGRQVISLGAAWAQAARRPELAGLGAAAGDLALLIYTSGSTAQPMGVMCEHRQVCRAVRAIAARLAYGDADTVLGRLPMSFDYGLYQAFLCALGGSQLALAPNGPGQDVELLRRIRQWQATVVPVVPSLAITLAKLAARDPRPTDVRLFTNTGAALQPSTAAALRQHFPRAKVCVMFGITECKRVSIMEPDGDLIRPGSVGRPLDGTTVTVVDESGRPLPVGEVGELIVRSAHVMSGYWRAGYLARERFRLVPGSAERELHTGDYGWLDEDGYLYFSGRRDEIFKRNGVRMSTTEIEAAAMDISHVRAAAVVSPDGARDLTAFVVATCTGEQVLAGLRQRLEEAKVPAACHVLPELPLNANGKVDKKLLTDLANRQALLHGAPASGSSG